MTEPKISVIIPVYNTAPYLRHCLDSVIGQTHKNLEIILVDDGSADNSGPICDEYAARDNRIVVIHKENGGVYAARNTALNRATGDYIGFVDSDDWIAPQMYEVLLRLLRQYDADVAQCQMINGGPFEQLETPTLGRNAIFSGEQLTSAMFRGEITHGLINKLFCAKIWETRRFDEAYYHVDAMEISKIAQYCSRFVRTDDALYHYNTTNDSITRGQKNRLHLHSREMLFECFERAAAGKFPVRAASFYPEANWQKRKFISIFLVCTAYSSAIGAPQSKPPNTQLPPRQKKFCGTSTLSAHTRRMLS